MWEERDVFSPAMKNPRAEEVGQVRKFFNRPAEHKTIAMPTN